jgi:hypothetical protein
LTLSILIPNDNYCKLVGDAERGAPTWAGDEVIEHDGTSSDGRDALLGEFDAHHPDVDYQSMPDGGQSLALNMVVARAAGELVGWLNSHSES